MATITTLSEMRSYILRQLGYPVINVEVSTDQLNDIITDSAQLINRYLYGEAGYADYISFSATSGIDEYDLSGNDVLDAFDIEFAVGSNGINTLFSPARTFLNSEYASFGNYYRGQGLNLASYQIQMMHLKDINNMFGRTYSVDFRPAQETLKITPTPNEDLVGLIFVYKKSTAAQLYNHEFMKKLTIAKARKLWGGIVGKFNMTLPGGGTFNGADLVSQGKEDEEDVMDSIKSEGEPFGFMIG